MPSSLSSSPGLEHAVGEVEDVGEPGQLAQVVHDVVVDDAVAVVRREQADAARRVSVGVAGGGALGARRTGHGRQPFVAADQQVVQQGVDVLGRRVEVGAGQYHHRSKSRLGARRSRHPSSTNWCSGSTRRVADPVGARRIRRRRRHRSPDTTASAQRTSTRRDRAAAGCSARGSPSGQGLLDEPTRPSGVVAVDALPPCAKASQRRRNSAQRRRPVLEIGHRQASAITSGRVAVAAPALVGESR